MKYIDEFRDGALARKLAADIRREAQPDRTYGLMEFCGGHTHAIFRYGVQGLLPDNIHMIHGPGCPVCVLPIGRVDSAIELARRPDVILCSYGDMLRVPGSNRMSLLKAKAGGADVRMIYSSADALKIAQENPDKEVVFFAIGFETTTPPTAVAILRAGEMGLKNFSVFSNHVLTPAAITAIMGSGEARVDGVVGPAHVSTVIGSRPYEPFAAQYHIPVVIAGFEPLDVMQAILMLVRQLNEGRAEVENEFSRAVTREGNIKAQSLVAEVFELRKTFEWRGLGWVPDSGLQIREKYAAYDAEKRFELPYRSVADHPACECSAIIRGVKKPLDCKVFGTVCTPDNPIGSCMVSSEGACAAYYTYGRYNDKNRTSAKRIQS
ncbi:MAG: hydrogenase formation protein HypD [Betaproteobacteria bacterium CG2_30_59_46]|nr:MAG: hydrogenase formation protein HypD [Betaproteobacteria bacterium CG2_30_59_46]PIQ11784.1 MAG: hydrogenase formation protein HypD [Hydrogenophilales bacterium CG18_big_fil_WC_8_21_14_2_50_58_12]PJB07265.1 MAG: hydrogenase formation protein HypD [Hydrogenophilales bacterium CG_4_9_14_3_um_filter_59_35]